MRGVLAPALMAAALSSTRRSANARRSHSHSRSVAPHSSEAALSKLVGSIDDFGQPLVRVAIVGRDDEMLVTVDTGFNREIMMGSGDALLLVVTMRPEIETVELGHGQSVGVSVGRLRIRWLGAERDATVFVSDRREPKRRGPIALIGTGLLAPHLLLVDFTTRLLEIDQQ